MKYYIYMTTNLINEKKYIGKHKGELDGSYLGSGTALLRAIDKYGKKILKKKSYIFHKMNKKIVRKKKNL